VGSRKVATTVYLTTVQDVALKEMARRTGLPVAELVRRGVDCILDELAVSNPAEASNDDAGSRLSVAGRRRQGVV
jgi:hypothetical protein